MHSRNKLYCLVYGQMSHWGATVITNLLSAIPFIGNDIVPLSYILPLYLFFISLSNYHTPFYINNNLLALIIGFIDGDGYIRISKKTNSYGINYIYISLVINLHENELNLLKYFNKHLNIGRVYHITPKKGNKLARWEINKTELFNILVPLLEENKISFLTENRQKQYLLLKYIKDNNLIYYEDINKNSIKINQYIENKIIKNNFYKLNYINNWLVGFTMAEGSFLIKKNKDICFQLKQKFNINLFKDIIKLLNTTRKLDINKNKYVQLSVSSIKDIQNIINFYSYSNNESLLGQKLISYNKWLLEIKNSKRYKNINIK